MCMQKLSRMLAYRTRSAAAWDLMAKYNINTNVTSTLSNPETFTSHYHDQMVKIDSHIYHLDRFKSSLKSNYFEKLFTSSDFEPKIDQVLEIQLKQSEVFPSIIDLIGGKKLLDVLSKDNLIPLLEAMDHLEMEINLEQVSSFIDENLKSYSPQDAKIFELYNFIKKDKRFEYLLWSIFKYLSNHLTTVKNSEIFPNLPPGHLIRIIMYIKNPNDEMRSEIIQTCTEWFCHDMENRLPHMLELVNSIKPEFNSNSEKESDEHNKQLSSRLPKCDVDEQAKRKIISRCLFSFLAYGGLLNPTIIDREDLAFMNFGGYESDYDFEYTEESQYEVYDENHHCEPIVNCNFEIDKLKKFLKNGHFCDITVRVGEKVYKLHRSVLESKSSYFLNIFQTEYAEAVAKSDGTLPITCPSKDKEYLLDDRVSPSAFDELINCTIYFDEHLRWSFFDQPADIFKAADILGIEKLSESCTSWLKYRNAKVSSQDVIEILNFTSGKIKYDDLYLLYLFKYMSSRSPEIDKLELGSVSGTMLENILKSSNFLPDDPRIILDFCSKWVIHDVENRYHFLPRLAQATNPFCIVDHHEFTTKPAVDFNHCSEQLIRDKLWEILSSVSHTVPSAELSDNRPEKSDQIPMFIGLKDEKTVDILNADLDQIASFCFSDSKITQKSPGKCPVSAAIKNDNLYMVCSAEPTPLFEIYQLSSKKRISLDFDPRLGMIFTLLNRNNEIYCCAENGVVMKYSTPFNRWIMISNRESDKSNFWYASDGEVLYRTYDGRKYERFNIEVYDFEKNSWSSAPNLPDNNRIELKYMTVVNDHNLAVLEASRFYLSDYKSNTWCYCFLPVELWEKEILVTAQYEDELLLMADNKLYQGSFLYGGKTYETKSWELRKELPLRGNKLPYESVAAIHRPKLLIN